MKAIKLILAFLLVVGGLVGVLMLVGSEDAPMRQELATGNDLIAKHYDQYTRSWNDADDWDIELFRRNCADVSVLSDRYNVKKLHDHNVNLAFQTVNSKLFDLWRSPRCTKSDVDKYIAAIDTITAYDCNMENNDGVKKIRRIYSAFANADNFVNKGFGLTPRFNGYNSTWNDFNTYRNNQIQQRNAIQADSLYTRYLSNISYIRDGLNQTETKLTEARSKFYAGLSEQIQKYYLSIAVIDRTQDKLNEFRNCVNRFESESGTTSQSLTALFNQFERTVK